MPVILAVLEAEILHTQGPGFNPQYLENKKKNKNKTPHFPVCNIFPFSCFLP
jgi:hypothetical protein